MAAMRKIFLVLLLLGSSPVMAAGNPATTAEDAAHYQTCLSRSQNDPQSAFEDATHWRANGGGIPAAHCEALSLVSLGRFTEAARKLSDLAENPRAESMRPQLLDQAGNAWLLAQQPGFALPLFSAAIAAEPRNVDYYADRARARAMHSDWSGADADLTQALGLDRQRADLFVLRASARHAMGRRAEARADLERALAIVPAYPEALVERGQLKQEAGDAAGARADWQTVVQHAPQSDAGVAARARLEALDSMPKAPAKKR